MRPPPTLLLQFLNLLVATSLYLGIKLGTTTWTAAGWTPFQLSLPVVLGCMAYGLSVSSAGRLADRFPRARVSMLGSAVGILAGVIPLLAPGPATCAVDVILVFLGAAIFFPGIAGLFSDAVSSQVGTGLPLHRRVSQYNLGWSVGTVLGMVIASILGSSALHLAGTDLELRIGYGIMILAFATAMLLLSRYRNLAQVPPQASGDRADHPALKSLTLMGRLGLLMACLAGFSLISQLDTALVGGMRGDAAASAASSELAAESLACYCAGYVSQFLLLGRWGGWILRPWRLWLLQCGLVAGTAGLLLLGQSGWKPPLAIAVCTYITGFGYGAAYTGSIYYSLRLPLGASRAAGLHETFLAVGNTIAPLLAAWLLQLLSGRGMAMLSALAVIAGSYGLISLLSQAVAIPGILRRFPPAGAEAAAAGRPAPAVIPLASGR